ncbi:hypothetical protein GQ602_007401 [Ophiocordyceps camponoti-floridani]|uniref:Uncharacterized protein n=1 Tax=Ophiocordyceps camponoti-floridani TaxID=2030778 RepID=A0A8H4Q0F1_9HYPO|nr:hypothetical protein GQ602_007401 [Ophiocordyceps camponoti-floridani]
MFHTLHCPRCRAWLYCPAASERRRCSPGPVATIRPRAPGALARGGGSGLSHPHAQVDSVGGWRLAAPPPRDPSGATARRSRPRAARRGSPLLVPKPAASARARDPGLTLEGNRTLTPGPAAAGSGPRERSATCARRQLNLCGGPVQVPPSAFAKDVFINQERKLGDRRRSDTVVVLAINYAD